MKEEKTLAEPDHAGEWQGTGILTSAGKSLCQRKEGEMSLPKLSSDTLCLSERCPAGLSATMARPNPPLDGNIPWCLAEQQGQHRAAAL